MKEFKVLHVLARADMGGGPRHVQYLLETIDENVDSFVCCPEDKPFIDIFKNLLGEDKISIIPHRKVSFKAFIALKKFVEKNNILIIHCHGKGASAYGKLLKVFSSHKIRLIYTPHGIHVDQYSSSIKLIYIIYEYLSAFLFDHVVYVSESEYAKAKKSHLFTHNSFSIISNGVPKFQPPNNGSSTGLRNSLFEFPQRGIIITLSRFDYQKNMDEAFKIAQLFPEYNFLWLGDGEQFSRLRSEISNLALKNINMIGVQNNVNDFLSISNLYLSTARWEGMPLALLEAMAAGLPIVASNVVGNSDVVDKHTGALYDLGDVNDAADKIKYILETLKPDKNNIKNYFEEKFSVNIMASKIFNLYNKLIK